MPRCYAMTLLLGLLGSMLLHVGLIWPVHYVPLVKLTARQPIRLRLLDRNQASGQQALVPMANQQSPAAASREMAAVASQARSRQQAQRKPRRPVQKQPSPRPQSTTTTVAASAEKLESASPTQSTTGMPELSHAAESDRTAFDRPVVTDLSELTPDELIPYDAMVVAQIRRHQYYPRTARARSMEGVVLLFLSIADDGSVQSVEVRKSSGFTVLDQAALTIVKDSAPFPAPQLYALGSRHYLLPITFKIAAVNLTVP